MATQPHDVHRWFTPADCAAMLLGVKQGASYRAPCPACDSTRTDALSIRQMPDRYGNPRTAFHCFAHDCHVLDICDALGIHIRNLFAIHPDYAKATRNAPRAHSPRINRLRTMEEPTPDEIAQIHLEEMIVSDPAFIQECQPAREKMWELAQASPKARECLTQALRQARFVPSQFWSTLAAEMEPRTPCN